MRRVDQPGRRADPLGHFNVGLVARAIRRRPGLDPGPRLVALKGSWPRLKAGAAEHLACCNDQDYRQDRIVTGARGDDIVLRVPVGTEIMDEDQETVIADLTEVGQRFLIAKGGNGGWGNLHFKSSTNQAPRRANPGQPGIERTIWLRLKLITDVGLLGLPNAGKSTFLAATSNARPKIADYPFTTLYPNLGVVGVDGVEFVVADIPGLIEGASEGRGLGDLFLGHVERCAVLLHLVDGTSGDPAKDYETIIGELEAYGGVLSDKPRITVLNKIDTMDGEERAFLKDELETAIGSPVMLMSGASQENVTDVLRALRSQIDDNRLRMKQAEADEDEEGEAPWQP